MGQRVDDLTDWENWEGWADADDWSGADAESCVEPFVSPVLREVLREDYLGADDEAYDDALEAVLDGMSAAEAFSFQKALSQLGAGAGAVLANPVVGQVARTALPVGAGALGTLIGGPAGTAIGSRLGTLAAGALVRPGAPAAPGAPGPAAVPVTPVGVPVSPVPVMPVPAPPVTPVAVPVAPVAPAPAVAGGSAAAAQGLVLTQQPDVLKALLALSMGQHGARQVGGVPVASVMNLLSSVFGQAAADADEIAYLDGDDVESDPLDAEEAEPDLGRGRSLYTTLMDAENEELAS